MGAHDRVERREQFIHEQSFSFSEDLRDRDALSLPAGKFMRKTLADFKPGRATRRRPDSAAFVAAYESAAQRDILAGAAPRQSASS
jgi:hypothetical protein